MESPTHSLVDTSLGTLPVILSILDFSTIKNDIFPVIATVFSKTSSLGIKIRGLEALQTLCGGTREDDTTDGDGLDGFNQSSKSKKKQQSVILDKYTIQEKVVPLLKVIKTKEPAVMMAALDVFKEVGKIADSDFLAMEALPILWAFSLGPLLNLQQFQAFMALIRSLSTRIEQEQTRKLQELSSTSSASANRNDFLSSVSAGRVNGLESPNGDEGDFESLVLGRKKTETNVANSFDGWATAEPSASQPSNSRTQPGQAISSTPAFSWSTPPPQTRTIPPNATSNNAPTIYGDSQPLSSFTALQPNTSTPSFSQPLQPSRPTSNTLTPSSSFTAPANKPIDWSASSASNWSGSTISTNPPAMSSSNVWAQPQRPVSNPPYGQSIQPAQSTFSIAPPPTSPYSSFGLPPPPAGGARQSSFGGAPAANVGVGIGPPKVQPQQPPSGQKSGLDKYQSLI
jgi:SCY1-like protein 2